MKKSKLLPYFMAVALGACSNAQYPYAQPNYDRGIAPVVFYNPPLEAVDVITLAKLEVDFLGDEWGGDMFPGRHVCKRLGGEGKTPPIRVRNIPQGTDFISLEFNDASDLSMAYEGAMGKIGVWHDGSAEINIPAIAAETYTLPKFAFIEQPHRYNTSKGEAYMAPCLLGAKHSYFMKVKAIKLEPTSGRRVNKVVLDETAVNLGVF